MSIINARSGNNLYFTSLNTNLPFVWKNVAIQQSTQSFINYRLVALCTVCYSKKPLVSSFKHRFQSIFKHVGLMRCRLCVKINTFRNYCSFTSWVVIVVKQVTQCQVFKKNYGPHLKCTSIIRTISAFDFKSNSANRAFINLKISFRAFFLQNQI